MTALVVTPLAGRIGAELAGVSLRALDEEDVAAVRAALLRHRVVFFRNQHLDAAAQLAVARRFGVLTRAHPTLPSGDGPAEVLDLDSTKVSGRANNWHTDVTFIDRPPFGSILRALVVPPYGGDTIWANTVGAYEDLPPGLRALADASWALHTNVFDYAAPAVERRPGRYDAAFTSIRFETEHPVVRVHPETAEPALLLGSFARRLVGCSSSESAAVLAALQSYVTRPENTVRWRWAAGDVAFWDNRATQHYAIYDYGSLPRRMQRVTLAGVPPLSLRGEPSRSIAGDASHYTPAAA